MSTIKNKTKSIEFVKNKSRQILFTVDNIRDGLINGLLSIYIYLNRDICITHSLLSPSPPIVQVYINQSTKKPPARSGKETSNKINVQNTEIASTSASSDDKHLGARKKIPPNVPDDVKTDIPPLSQTQLRKRKKGTSTSILRIKSRLQPDKKKSRAWVEESREAFIKSLTGEAEDDTLRKRNYLRKNEGRRDADILGIDLPEVDISPRKFDSESSEPKKKKTVAIDTSQVMNTNYVKIITNNPDVISMARNSFEAGDSLLTNSCKFEKKSSLFRKLFNRSKQKPFTAIEDSIELSNSAAENDEKILKFIPFYQDLTNNIYAESVKLTKTCLKRMQNSEKQILNNLSTYITNSNDLDQLKLLLRNHQTLQQQNEYDLLTATNELHQKQLDTNSKQREQLLNVIDSLLTENRRLQNDYDTLEKQNELLLINLKIQQHSSIRLENIDDMNLSLYQNNYELRKRYQTNLKQMEIFERELTSLKDFNIDLSNSNRLLHIEIDNQKLAIDQLNDTITIANDKLKMYETNAIKLAEKINCNNNNFISVVDKCLLCLDQSKIDIKYEKIMNYETNALKLAKKINCNSKNFNTITENCLNYIDKINIKTSNENQLKYYEKYALKLAEKINCNSTDFSVIVDKYLHFVDQYKSNIIQDVKEKLKQLLNDYNNFKTSVNNNRNRMQMKLISYQTEFDNFNKCKESNECQIKELKTTINELQKQLSNNEKSTIKYQYENDYLNIQIANYKKERDTIIEYQNQCYDNLLKLNNELDEMRKTNESLQERFQKEHEDKLNLEYDNRQQKEYLDMYKKLPSALQQEKQIVKELERNVIELQNELTKLNVVQECQRQIQNHQNSSQIIEELNKNITDLLDQHMNDTNEKIMLCSEVEILTKQMKSIKDKLDKNKSEEMTALQQLNDEYQKVVNERNLILENYQVLLANQEQLQNKFNIKSEEYNAIYQSSMQLQDKLIDLKTETEKLTAIFDKQMQLNIKTINQLKEDKQTMKDSIEYLQCTSKKQFDEINELRQLYNEKDNQLKQATLDSNAQINQLVQQLEILQNKDESEMEIKKILKQAPLNQQDILNELHKRNEQLEHLQKQYQKIQESRKNDFETFTKLTDDIKSEFWTYKYNVQQDLEKLFFGSLSMLTKTQLDDEMKILKDDHRQLSGELIQTVDLLMHEQIARQHICNKYAQLTADYNQASTKLEALNIESESLKKQIDTYRTDKNQLTTTIEHLKEQNKEYLNKISDLTTSKNDLIVEKDHEINELKCLNDCLEQQIANLQANLAANHTQILKLQKQIGELEQEVIRLKFDSDQLKLTLLQYIEPINK